MFDDRSTPHQKPEKVTEIREKIKSFLAAQGMIKGHSGAGQRGTEQEMLLLAPGDHSDGYSSTASSTSRTPDMTLSDEDHCMDPSSTFEQNWLLIQASDSRERNESFHPEPQYPPYDPSLLAFNNFFAMPNYFQDHNQTCDPIHVSRFLSQRALMDFTENMLHNYRKDVISVQYMFADDALRDMIYAAASSHGKSRTAAILLASVHYQRYQYPNRRALQTQETRNDLDSLWSQVDRQHLTSGDAMAALHVVSSYLFDGGNGAWEQWLQVSCNYVLELVRKNGGPSRALFVCDAKDAFIIKTSIWFDVLASVTTQKKPLLLHVIEEMFGPRRIIEVLVHNDDRTSMISPMGCHNEVVWALAKTSELSWWKEEETKAGRLSIPALVDRARSIEAYLDLAPEACIPGPIQDSRALASDIFRSSARLYLWSVVSGDYLDVPEITTSVEKTIECMKRLSTDPANQQSVVRNTVFGFFICGAFAQESRHRDVIKTFLTPESRCRSTGNCGSVHDILEDLWAKRDGQWQRHAEPETVGWRNRLLTDSLLLV
ncbi:hypothetical protein H0H81_012419 [Sphagnurus paluster]|uniref:Uncharacterized protein n=1 Tax=Sphagnurus paluster TaxID=117069 RepID=A0A9P7G0Z1_9AGAR|nr:hypothetical protein H0H81_012419 [Sphagnurus paluster]